LIRVAQYDAGRENAAVGVVVRFAPSPTGYMHIGNARTALLNWIFAKQSFGDFVLRFDNTDRTRSDQKFETAILDDLSWLGIHPDSVKWQAKRASLYDDVLDKLKNAGRVYACYETEDELEQRRKQQLEQGLPPIYDSASLEWNNHRRKLLASRTKPHWRFKLNRKVGCWKDMICGEQSVNTMSLSDPIVKRQDDTYLYILSSVIDDIDMGVTHVIRGRDHIINTAVQLEMFAALAEKPPAFAHHGLLLLEDGSTLSKRSGDLSISSLRNAGFESESVVSLATLLGSAEKIQVHERIESLIPKVKISCVSHSSSKFCLDELVSINASLLRRMEYEKVASRLADLGVDGGKQFWLSVRANCSTVHDALLWWKIVKGPVNFQSVVCEADINLLKEAFGLLPGEPWDDSTWGAWIAKVRNFTGCRDKSLVLSIRKILTGLDYGPELKYLLPLLGKQRVLERAGAWLVT